MGPKNGGIQKIWPFSLLEQQLKLVTACIGCCRDARDSAAFIAFASKLPSSVESVGSTFTLHAESVDEQTPGAIDVTPIDVAKVRGTQAIGMLLSALAQQS